MALTKYVAMDCEMVGIGKNYRQDILARVSIVNEHGHVLYDTYVKATQPVTDYRTSVSGIRKINLDSGEDFDEVQRKVQDIIKGRILVGHAIENDFAVLKITHPEDDVRDTGHYFESVNNNRTPALKWLAERFLGTRIQTREHSSVEDARTCMKVYKFKAAKWEQDIAKQR